MKAIAEAAPVVALQGAGPPSVAHSLVLCFASGYPLRAW